MQMLPRALPSLPLGRECDQEEEGEDEEKRKRWGCVQWDERARKKKKKHMWTNEGRKLLLKAALGGGILVDF